MENHQKILEKFSASRILVVGDVMLDKYLLTKVDRISPEAPVPIALVKGEKKVLGGAANVANNLIDLGAQVTLIGTIGNDQAGEDLKAILKNKKFKELKLYQDSCRQTVEKIRVVSHSQQLLRIDYEDYLELDLDLSRHIYSDIEKILDDYQAVILSDYGKGFFSYELTQKIIQLARAKKKLIVVDPKPIHRDYYKGACLITPNLKEAELMSGMVVKNGNHDDLIKIGKHLQKDLEGCAVVLTLGEKGMMVFEGQSVYDIKAIIRQVYDTSGAGDTVIAVITAALSQGASLKEASELANIAGGLVVEKFGTVTISLDELKKEAA